MAEIFQFSFPSWRVKKLRQDNNMHFASLFNGNIAQMNTSLPTAAGIGQQKLLDSTLGNVYQYDQLNRLRNHFSFTNLDKMNNEWISSNNIVPPQMPQMGMDQNFEAFNYDANGNILTLQRHGHKTNMLMQMDDLSYKFQKQTIGLQYTYKGNTQTLIWDRLVHNKLKYVTDQVAAANYTNDVETQNTLNYTYDKLGNLIKDNAEDIATIKWNVSGKIEEIIRTTNSTKPDLEFGYNTQGTRMYKIVKPKNSGGGLMYQHAWKITYYVRDLQGSVMATYTQTYSKFTPNGASTHLNSHYVLNDHHIYGSSRVGVQRSGKQQTKRELLVTYFYNGQYQFNTVSPQNTVTYTATINSSRAILYRGYKTYQLTNHLGNVLATIQDRKLNKNDNTGPVFTTQYYIPFVNSVTDYYAFGSEMGGRSFSINFYSFGFNGMLKDNDMKGNSNSYNTEYRILDVRLARWLTVDPVTKENKTPYEVNSNKPTTNNDPKGDCDDCPKSQINIGVNFNFGSHTKGYSLNASLSQQIGNFKMSYGFGVSYYGNFANTGKSGTEFRNSFQAGFNNGKTEINLGTNLFKGSGEMSEFNQRTGIINMKFGKVSVSYENDGFPFDKIGLANKVSDSYRTAAFRIGIGKLSAGFKLFTGKRKNYNDVKEMKKGSIPGPFNTTMPHGFVNEIGTPYRMGAAYLGYGNLKLGIESDRYIRHYVQDWGAHHIAKKQPGFRTMSNSINPYFYYQPSLSNRLFFNINTPNFTLWGTN